ncbi:MAG: hypothetical protein H0U74_11570, partial [Bradymonadaceae bacterium]|nr:hypothetical protein [Lujinxingiaceae bacterium]
PDVIDRGPDTGDTDVCPPTGCLPVPCEDSVRSSDGLIALYDFEEGAGSVVYDRSVDYVGAAVSLKAALVFGQDFNGQIHDESGNAHHGTLRGGAQWSPSGGPTPGLPGYLSHDASEQSYTEVAHHPRLQLATSQTIAYWRRHKGSWGDEIGIDLSKGDNSYAIKHRATSPTILEWDLRGGPQGSRAATASGSVAAATWHFVVMTWDGAQARIFVDDMERAAAGPTTVTAPIAADTQLLLLAAQNAVANDVRRYSNVDITGLALFDRALDTDERKFLHNAGRPMDLEIVGDTHWLENGIGLDGGGLRQLDASPLYDRILEGQHAFSFEMWVKANNTTQGGPARIVSLSRDPFNRNFTLGAQVLALEMRLRNTDTNDNGAPAPLLQPAQVTTDLEHYVITLSQRQATLYRNGQLVHTVATSTDLSSWQRTFPLLLGNEATLDRPWLGAFYLLAIYDRPLDLATIARHFAEGPATPPRCTVPGP